MKRFNITTGHPIILGRRLPSMCIYGTYPLVWYSTRKVYDKHGKCHKKRDKHTRDITYIITDFKLSPIGMKDALWFECYNPRHDTWERHNTAERRIYQQLFDFVYPLIERNELYDVIPEEYVPASTYPQPKKAQVWSDSVIDFGSVGYVLSTHVMTDDVVKKQFVDSYRR